MTTDPSIRAEFIAGLRRLAAFLADNPKVPVPSFGAEISIYPLGSDDDKRAAVDRVADLIGSQPSDGTDYITARDFGPITYRAIAISTERMSGFDAWLSFRDAVSA
ncbi:hypothetical protein [Sphaerimonospora mesophila]|uniref:hypothetical protein n=1 Tax=Sphaerimonospora mesophila TaxID=37483 RepID=UPI0006E15DDD